MKRVRLGQVRFHDLRHTYASLMIRAGIHPKVLQSLMGHSSIRVTMDTYGHCQDADEAVLGAFEQLLRRELPHHSPIEQTDEYENPVGAYRDRTGDLRLAKPALSQLS